MDTPKFLLKYSEKLLLGVLFLLGLLAVLKVGFLARDLSIHEDEYQHTHLAWNALNGKIIYRDFHDTHGPLSNLWYRQVLKLVARDGELVQSFYRIRYFNLFFVFLTGILVAYNIFLLSKSSVASLIGFGFYFVSPLIASVAFRIRPDCYVGFFSVLSLCCWLKKRYFLMGVCLGMCFGFHAKFLPINLFIWLGAYLLTKTNKKPFYFLLLGEVLVIAGIATYFWFHRALSFGVQGMIGSGFQTAFKRIVVQGDLNRLLRSVSRTENWLMILLGMATLILVIRFYRSRKVTWDLNWGMAAFFTLAGILFLLAPVWAHAFVFVLPTIIPFLVSALFLLPAFNQGLGFLFLVGGIFLFLQDPRKSDRGKEILAVQLESLKRALMETKRTEPIFYIWTSRCPAYVFNSDPRPQWTQPFKRWNSKQPIRQLPPINYLSIHPLFLPALEKDEREYIQEHFKPDGCFWKRIK